MELHAYTKTISDLFSVKKTYVVPRFQREYSWSKEQVKELWDDILAGINFRVNGDNFLADHEEYFIGSLVLVGDDKSSEMQIVDGQQRLTTITILLSVLCDRFNEIEKQNIATSLYENYITGKDDNGDLYFKLKNETPKPFFQNSIQHIDKKDWTQPATEEEKTLFSSYKDLTDLSSKKSIAKQIKLKQRKSISDDQYEEILKHIRDQVTKYLKVIFITVADEDEAYTIFETLNARGLNLSFVDLIKNKLFKELKQTHPDDLAKTKWRDISKIISSRDGVGDMETYVRHWWLSKHTYSSGDNIYKSFKKISSADDFDAKKFIKDLHCDASEYIKISSPVSEDFRQQEDKIMLRSLSALKVFSITQQRPFLLSLFNAKKNKLVSHKDLVDCLCFIENFHFLFNAISSQRPSGIDASYSAAARELNRSSNKQNSHEIIAELKGKLKARSPEKVLFLEKFKELKYLAEYTKDKKTIQYIFNRIEIHKSSSMEFSPDELTLEHISPQSENLQLKGLIGNLLPLGKALNNEAGNKKIIEKIEVYKKSEFSMTKEFSDDFVMHESWTDEKINTRTDKIAEYCYDEVFKLDI